MKKKNNITILLRTDDDWNVSLPKELWNPKKERTKEHKEWLKKHGTDENKNDV